ncbi:MAG: enterochelin esterase [Xanthomonadales bacterium]|nr:enterochelin esterase [Gammaproteobacteria bacterium]NNK03431.1 enterochelin esterase [Xanthomonadales bacterium]
MVVRPKSDWPCGEIVSFKHRSNVLGNNIWGDPDERDLHVYLPAGYSESGEALVALWDFAAFTNAGPGHLNWRNQGENLPQRLDRLIATGEMPPVVVPMPDCYSSLGGNQYINSSAVGLYADYVVEELVPFLSTRVNVSEKCAGRGVFGKSSGGYGALVHAMYYSETWGGVAAHAADMGFEWVYRPAFPQTAAALSALGGDPYRFLKNFWLKKSPGSPDYATLMTLAMAASYDPGGDGTDAIQLPFDLHTCELDPDRWEQWLSHDPVNMVDSYAQQLAALHLLYIDVGNRDQYNIQYGARAFIRRLEKLGIEHHYEEFDGTHSGMDWRLDTSLPMLAKTLYQACGIESPGAGN